MSSVTIVPRVGAAPRSLLQRWVIGLGWLGFGLWAVEWLTSQLRLESVTHPDTRLAYHLLQVLLGWLWPLALSLHVYRLVKPGWLRDTLAALVAFLVAPAIGCSLLFAGFYYIDHGTYWQTQQVLFRRATAPSIEVARQIRDDPFVTSYPGYRVVQLTPVLGLWQLVEPVDTTHFDATGWRQVKR